MDRHRTFVRRLRWSCVLPAAFLAWWLTGGMLAALAQAFGIDLRSHGYHSVVHPFVQYFASGVAFPLAGAWVAPKRRGLIAICMSLVLVIASSYIHILSQSDPGLTNTMHWLGESVGAGLGTLLVSMKTRAREDVN